MSRAIKGRQFGAEPHRPSKHERSPESEADQARRKMREWLRDRDETNVCEWCESGPSPDGAFKWPD